MQNTLPGHVRQAIKRSARATTSQTTRRLATMAIAVLGLIASSCKESRPTWPEANELTVAIESAPIHLDPRVGTDQASGRVFELVFNGLLTKTPQGNLIPDLAVSWEILDAGRRMRFHLRDGVTFHSGQPLTARDVSYTFNSMIDGAVTTPKKGALDRVSRVEPVDRLVVDFHLSEPYGPLLTELTCFLGIIPEGSDSDEINRNPIGTGPFRLVERTPERVELAPYDDYWEGRPELDRLVLREVPDDTVRALELRKGTVQLAVDLPPDVIPLFRAQPYYQVVESPGSKYAYLGLHMEDPILGIVEVRRAIAHAIDRKKIVDALWNRLGTVTETMIPPGHWAHHEGLTPLAFNPEEAKRLLDRAGFPDPDGEGPGARFKITYKTSTREVYVLQAQVIQAMLDDVGIEVEIRSHEFATFYTDIKRGNFQMFSLIWTGIVDPNIYSLVLHSEKTPPNGANRGRYRNPEFDALIDQGSRLSTPEQRRPYYLEAQEILAQELPYISLYNRINVAVVAHPLKGYQNFPSGEFYSLKDMYWERSSEAAPTVGAAP